MDTYHLEITTGTDYRRTTVATVALNVVGWHPNRNAPTRYFQGASAMRVDEDDFRLAVGEKLAVGRALRDLGRQMTREAMEEAG